MAVKATSQVDVVDLTDGYSVGLSGYSHTFAGNASGAVASSQSTTATVKAMCGPTQVDCSVSSDDITAPTGISASATKASGSMSPVVTITASTSFTKANAGKVSIPVKVQSPDGELTFVQEFAVTVAEKGDTPVITATKSGTKTKILADGTQIAEISDGTNGAAGLNQATVYLYKRADSAAKPTSGTSTYTFATGVLSNAPSGWSQTFPAETQGSTTPVWMMVAIASSNAAADTIAYSEWSTPVKMVSSGSNGTNGAAGYNQATVFLYQRAASAPSKPSSAVTYTFATGALSSTPSGWSRSVPNGDDPCYVTQAACVSQSATYSIAANAWTTPTKLAEDGEKGDDAISLVIESSAGFIFKNAQAATTLTARVFQGGAELTASQIQALGAIKWYKDGGSTAVGTGTTLSITAGTVTNHASYTANLEA